MFLRSKIYRKFGLCANVYRLIFLKYSDKNGGIITAQCFISVVLVISFLISSFSHCSWSLKAQNKYLVGKLVFNVVMTKLVCQILALRQTKGARLKNVAISIKQNLVRLKIFSVVLKTGDWFMSFCPTTL